MTQTMLEPTVLRQPASAHVAFDFMREAAWIVAHAPPDERGTLLMVFFEALRREGIDVLGLVPCVLDEFE